VTFQKSPNSGGMKVGEAFDIFFFVSRQVRCL